MATRIAGRDAHGLSRRTAQTGLLVAAFVVPGSFASSLTPRSWTDQGIITGFDPTLNYLLTATTQDVVEAAAGGVAPRLPWLRAAPPAARQRAAAFLLDLAIVPLGVAAQRALPRVLDESVARGLVRQAAWRTTTTGAGAAVFALVHFGTDALDRRVGAGGRIAGFPVAVPAGLALAAAVDHVRKARSDDPIMTVGFRPLRCNHWRHRPASSGSSPPSPRPSTRSPSSPEPPCPVPCPARSSGGG